MNKNVTPPITIAVVPTILASIIGLVVALLIGLGKNPEDKHVLFSYCAAGVTFGFLLSASVWTPSLLKIYVPSRFFDYAKDAPAPIVDKGEKILTLHIYTSPTEARWIKGELTENEWRTMCVAVYRANKFSIDVLNGAFGNPGGREVYGKIVEQLKFAKILKQDGKGVAITDDFGKIFFKSMATLPFPYSPSPPGIMQLL